MGFKRCLHHLVITAALLACSAGRAAAAPSPVNDLTVAGAGFSHVTLTWTVPYDAAASTTPAYYEIRTSTWLALVSDADWQNNSSSNLYPYRIAISTSEVAQGDPQTFTVTGLANGTGVFFAMESSTDGLNWSTIDNSGPRPYTAPFNTNPDNVGGHNLINGTVVYTSTPTLTWTAPPAGDSDDQYGDSIVSYTVELSTDVNFGIKTVKDGILTNSWITSPLSDDTTYYWRVRAYDSGGLASPGYLVQASKRFVSDGVNKLPLPFAIVSPIGDAIIGTDSPQFQWNLTTDPDPIDTLTYSVVYSTSQDFGVNCTTVAAGQTLNVYTVTDPLMENYRYYWKVYAVDQRGGAEMSASTGTFRVNANPNEAPYPFSLVSPSSGAMVTSASAALAWQTATDPDPGNTITYTVDYSSYDKTLSIFGEFVSSAGLVPAQFATPALQENTSYWWRVTAFDNTGLYSLTDIRVFYINAVNDSPASFDLKTSSGIIQTLLPQMSWGASADPDKGPITYTVYYSSYPDFSAYVSSAGITATSWSLQPPLREDATYYWKVRAVNQSAGYTVSNETWTVITDTAAENPGAFSLLSPADGSSGTYLKPSLDWADANDPDPFDYVLDYTLYYSTVSDFSVQTVVGGLTQSTYTFAGALQNDSTYWWKVQANAALTGATTSQTWRFRTVNQPPFAFSLYAASGTIGTATPTLSWQDAIDPEGDAVTYTVYYSSYSDFSSFTSSAGLVTASYTTPALDENRTYYWYTTAFDSWGNARQSAQWSFAVNTLTEAPAAFSLLSPADGSVTYSVRPALDWQDSSAPDPGTTLTYTLWYGTDNTFASRTTVTGLASSAHSPASNLTPGTTVYWRVYAVCSNGLETPSQTWSMYVGRSVMPAAPLGFTLNNVVEGESVRLDWDTVTANTDGSALSNLAGFRIYRAYAYEDIFQSSSAATVASSVLSWQDDSVNNQTVYYAVRAFTADYIDGEYSAVQVASAENQTIVSDEGREVIVSFHSGTVPSTMTVEVARISDEETGNVLRAFMLRGRTADGSLVTEAKLDRPLTIKIKQPGSAAASRAPGSATLSSGLFWHNGVEWIYLGGEKDGTSVTIQASSFGHYQLRVVERATDFRMLSLWPKIITPNGDGINDEFNVTFENPTAERVDGSIYDLSGMFIVKMAFKTEYWLTWDGRFDNGTKVPAGIYFYQVKVGSKVRHGSIVVAK